MSLHFLCLWRNQCLSDTLYNRLEEYGLACVSRFMHWVGDNKAWRSFTIIFHCIFFEYLKKSYSISRNKFPNQKSLKQAFLTVSFLVPYLHPTPPSFPSRTLPSIKVKLKGLKEEYTCYANIEQDIHSCSAYSRIGAIWRSGRRLIPTRMWHMLLRWNTLHEICFR